MLVGCATAASLFPFVGTIVYMILRPPEYLEDVRERELEMQAAEARLHELDQGLCPTATTAIERDFVRCPSCLRKLKERCVSCSRPLDQAWTICPYCETEVPGAIAAARVAAARRGRAAAARERPARVDGELIAAQRGRALRSRRPTTPRSRRWRRRRDVRADAERRPGLRAAPPAPARRSPGGRPRPSILTNLRSDKGRHGPHADPREARRLRPRADRARSSPASSARACRSWRCAT